MKIKAGDTVRFLNATGGGKVTRIEDKKGLVFVEDTDGFEIPTLERDCVVVPVVNEKTNFPVKDFSSSSLTKRESPTVVRPKTEPQTVQPEPVFETPEGEQLNAFLAFFPVDIKQLQTCSYDCFLVNDSNYFLYYNVLIGKERTVRSIANGLIEPNVQEELTSVTKEQLNDWEEVRVQLLPFKQSKEYVAQSVVDVSLKLNPIKFYKLHSFAPNEYFDEPCLMIDLVNASQSARLAEVSAEDIRQAMMSKEQLTGTVPTSKPKTQKTDVLEFDLHINELVDSTAGMSNADMLELQLAKFHQIMAEYSKHKGQKIVFIHGKGEGVLRKEIEKQLKIRYKSCYFQDASFREYGFGATMVTIK